MRRFEMVEGTSAKFWAVEVRGTEVVTRHGRIGTEGRETVKEFDSAEAATKAADALITQKTRKGYAEVDSASAPAAKAPEANPAQAESSTAAGEEIPPFAGVDSTVLGKLVNTLRQSKRDLIKAITAATKGLSADERGRLVVHLAHHGLFAVDSDERLATLLMRTDGFTPADCEHALAVVPDDTSGFSGTPPPLVDGVSTRLHLLLGVAVALDVAPALGPNLQRALDLVRLAAGQAVPEGRRAELLAQVLARAKDGSLQKCKGITWKDEAGKWNYTDFTGKDTWLLDRLGPDGGWQHAFIHAQVTDKLQSRGLIAGFTQARWEDVCALLNAGFTWPARILAARQDSAEALAALARETANARLRSSAILLAVARSDGVVDLTGLAEQLSFADLDVELLTKIERPLRLLGSKLLGEVVARDVGRGAAAVRSCAALLTDDFPVEAAQQVSAALDMAPRGQGWGYAAGASCYACQAMFDEVRTRLGQTQDVLRRKELWSFLCGLVAAAGEKTPPGVEDLVDHNHISIRPALGKALLKLPAPRAENALRRWLDHPERPLDCAPYVQNGFSEAFSRAVAGKVAALAGDKNLGVALNGSCLRELGPAFGDHVREALGDKPLTQAFVEVIRTHVSDEAAERLKGTRAVVDVASQMRELAAQLSGPRVRVYQMRRCEPAVGGSRVGGRAPGLKAEVPTHGGAPLHHVLTLELADVPELATRYPGAAGLALFVLDGWDSDPDTTARPFKLLPVAQMEPHDATGSECGIQFEALDVPVSIFDDPSGLKGPAGMLRDLLYRGGGHIMGGPLWMHDGPYGANENFILQLNDELIQESINLGDAGDLYVFADHAEWACH